MTKTYSIHEVAELFDLPISTIRYYDKKGLLPFVAKNEAGNREFTRADLGFIKTICCLKNTGMPIKNIRQYIQYCMQGPTSMAERHALLEHHRQQVLNEQAKIAANLVEIDRKIAKYSDPSSTELIANQLRIAGQEKVSLGLDNPFNNF
ncbi:MerR family transcriptional regulator [Lentilactobacillus senioris]|uniref:MerR family transcriptional regulator n=1 Tax=Lentilactobacillus senioris TaxID=931534 RepID=UPI003D2C1E49